MIKKSLRFFQRNQFIFQSQRRNFTSIQHEISLEETDNYAIISLFIAEKNSKVLFTLRKQHSISLTLF